MRNPVTPMRKLESEHPGAVRAVPCDTQDAAAVAAPPQQALDAFGRLDSVVDNAGIAPAGKLVGPSPAVWQQVMAVNVTAPMLLAQGSGKIINIASTPGILGNATLVCYLASRGSDFATGAVYVIAGYGFPVSGFFTPIADIGAR